MRSPPIEHLKLLDAIGEVDPRQNQWPVYDDTLSDWRAKTVEDHYAIIASFDVPLTVFWPARNAYVVACNTLLYSWFQLAMVQVAELHVLASLELALKERGLLATAKNPGLRRLLGEAVHLNLIRDLGVEEFAAVRLGTVNYLESISQKPSPDEDPADTQKFVKRLVRDLPDIRNNHAHGTFMIIPGVYSTFSVVGRLITQLYSEA